MMEEIKFEVNKEYCYDSRYRAPTIIKIVRITPKGFLIDEGGSKYKPNGRIVGGDIWNSVTIRPITEKDRRDIESERLLFYISNYKFTKQFPLESLRKIAIILNNEERGLKHQPTKQSAVTGSTEPSTQICDK